MKKEELLLKTLFCCSACDGDIAKEEVELVQKLTESVKLFETLNVEEKLNQYISEINALGKVFLKNYFAELSEFQLTDEDQIQLIDLAIRMIEADNQILYSEVKFFKRIRNCLPISNQVILENLPQCEEYLLPDISSEDKDFDGSCNFAPISFSSLH